MSFIEKIGKRIGLQARYDVELREWDRGEPQQFYSQSLIGGGIQEAINRTVRANRNPTGNNNVEYTARIAEFENYGLLDEEETYFVANGEISEHSVPIVVGFPRPPRNADNGNIWPEDKINRVAKKRSRYDLSEDKYLKGGQDRKGFYAAPAWETIVKEFEEVDKEQYSGRSLEDIRQDLD